jgi:NADPH:quinone reductase-like Zn-dependent oxidoreductase
VIEDQRSIGRGLGCDCSGIVTRVGPKAEDLRVGDRVLCVETGSFRSRIALGEKLCAKVPNQISFEEAATMTTVFGTALYCLEDIARMKKGDVSNKISGSEKF